MPLLLFYNYSVTDIGWSFLYRLLRICWERIDTQKYSFHRRICILWLWTCFWAADIDLELIDNFDLSWPAKLKFLVASSCNHCKGRKICWLRVWFLINCGLWSFPRQAIWLGRRRDRRRCWSRKEVCMLGKGSISFILFI